MDKWDDKQLASMSAGGNKANPKPSLPEGKSQNPNVEANLDTPTSGQILKPQP